MPQEKQWVDTGGFISSDIQQQHQQKSNRHEHRCLLPRIGVGQLKSHSSTLANAGCPLSLIIACPPCFRVPCPKYAPALFPSSTLRSTSSGPASVPAPSFRRNSNGWRLEPTCRSCPTHPDCEHQSESSQRKRQQDNRKRPRNLFLLAVPAIGDLAGNRRTKEVGESHLRLLDSRQCGMPPQFVGHQHGVVQMFSWKKPRRRKHAEGVVAHALQFKPQTNRASR